MALVFPNNPSLGQISVQNGRVYVWSGYAWEFVSVGASGNLSATVTIPSSGDQYWTDTLLLLNGDGSVTDSSSYVRSVTANGASASGSPKFGSGSILFNGSYDRISVDSADFNFLPSTNSSWTIEAWLYPTSFSQYQWIFGYGITGNLNVPAVNAYISQTSGTVQTYLIAASGDVYMAGGTATPLSLNQWQHFAMVYDAQTQTFKCFIDGVQTSIQSKPSGGTWTSGNTNSIRIGNYWTNGGGGDWGFIGRIDDFRITKAVRYTSAFTPPTVTHVTGQYIAPRTLPVIFSGGTTPVLADSRFDLFLPLAPTNLTAAAGNAQVSLSWTAPSATYIPPITDYVVQFKEASASLWNTFSDGTSTSTSATVTGLTNGTAYVFRVAAVNGVGTGAYTAATSSVTPNNSVSVQYLVIAGGGGGGIIYGGGGGAGGYLTSSVGLSPGVQYTVTVGAGGAGAVASNAVRGVSGSNSSLSSIEATGGGGGGSENQLVGANGGSGGGGCIISGGSGVSGQGFGGGSGFNPNNDVAMGGGGGGAGGAGGNASNSSGGAGGAGQSSSITGTSVARAGGGGGGVMSPSGAPGGLGGSGGGGSGGQTNNGVNATSGTASTGSGGGGGVFSNSVSGNGGSGVVIIRTTQTAASTTGSPTVTTVGSDTVYTFTGTGSITF